MKQRPNLPTTTVDDLIEVLRTENTRLKAALARREGDEWHPDDEDRDDDRAYRYGCGEYDTVDSRGQKLRNNGRICNDAGEPYWM